MQLVKIGFFVILLSIILFFIVKDHKEKDNSISNQTYEGSKNNKISVTKEIKSVGSCAYLSDGKESSEGESGCSSCAMPGSSAQLLPVMDPLFNMREICKQSILLEDHLFQKKKRCKDCCIKHQLTIEALAEEAITLDKDRKCEDLYYLPDRIRELQKDFVNGREPTEIAQEYRKVRKSLMQRCFNNF